MDANGGVGGAGAARDERYAWAFRHLAVGLGHIGDAALLSADDEVDLGRIVQRVQGSEIALARHAEDAVASLGDQIVDEDATPGADVRHGFAPSRRTDRIQAVHGVP